MRLGFVTCVQLGLDCMDEIYKVGGKLDLAITLKDELSQKKSGRIYLDSFCEKHNIPLFKIRSINDEDAIHTIRSNHIDWLFIIGWSQIARTAALEAPARGVLGMHPTLLPVGRGRASIPWAILKGVSETGVTLFKLDEGVDTGPILAQEKLVLASNETATSLYGRVCAAHRSLIHRIWQDLIQDRIVMKSQDNTLATEWPGRTPEDGRIVPSMKTKEVECLVRATTHPYPGAFFEEKDAIVRIWEGEVGNSGSSADPSVYRVHLSDGVYDAIDFEISPK